MFKSGLEVYDELLLHMKGFQFFTSTNEEDTYKVIILIYVCVNSLKLKFLIITAHNNKNPALGLKLNFHFGLKYFFFCIYNFYASLGTRFCYFFIQFAYFSRFRFVRQSIRFLLHQKHNATMSRFCCTLPRTNANTKLALVQRTYTRVCVCVTVCVFVRARFGLSCFTFVARTSTHFRLMPLLRL